MSRRWFWLSWIGIVLFALVLRFWQLGKVPVSLYWDEAAMLVDLKSVTETDKDMHGRPWYQVIYPSYGDYKLPMYIWSATTAAKLFGVSEFSQRFPSALAGVLTVVMAGWLAKLLMRYGTKTKYSEEDLNLLQLLTMAVVTVTPWSVMFSRTGFEGHLGQALLTSSIALFIWVLGNQKFFLIWLPTVLGVAATYSYFSVRFVWVAVYMLVLGLFLFHHVTQKKKLTLQAIKKEAQPFLLAALAGVVLFGALLLPLLRSPLAKETDRFRLGTASILNNEALIHESNLYKELAGNTIIDRILYHRYALMTRELLKNYSDNMSPAFLFLSGDPNLRHGTGQFGLFLWSVVPMFLIGWAVLGKRHLTVAGVLFLWWMTALLPASVPENTPHALRSLNALAPLSVVIGFGAWWSWKKLEQLQFKKISLVIPARAAVGAIVFLSFVHFWWFYMSVYPALSANDWQSEYATLAKDITQLAEQDKVYVHPFDDRFYLWLMAYGPYKASEFQTWKSHDFKFQGTQVPDHFKNIEFAIPESKKLEELVKSGLTVRIAYLSDSPPTVFEELAAQKLECAQTFVETKFKICTVTTATETK